MAGTYGTYTTFALAATGSVTALGAQDNVGTVQVGGTYTSVSGTIQVTADPPSVASPVWNNVDLLRVDTLALEQSPTWTDSTVRMWKFDCTNVQQVRVNLTAGTLTSGMSVRVQTSYVPTGALAGISYATSVGGNQAITGNVVITSASANALTAGLAGSTNPAFNVDASTASSATGLNIKSAAAAAGLAVKVVSSGTNEALTIDAKGSGAIALGDTSTGPLYVNRGALAALQVGLTLTNIGTQQSSSPTSAQLLGGLLTQTGATGAGVITLPSGTALSTACNRTPAVGDTFECNFVNVAGGQTLTVTGTTGTTVVGGATIATGVGAKLIFYNSGSNTWNIYLA